jgi:acetolactate synthase small subunit
MNNGETYVFSITAENALRAVQRIVILFTRSRLMADRLSMAVTDAAGACSIVVHLRSDRAIAERTLKQLRRIEEIMDVHLKPLTEELYAQHEIRPR